MFFCKCLDFTHSLSYVVAKLILIERRSQVVQWIHTPPGTALYREEGGAGRLSWGCSLSSQYNQWGPAKLGKQGAAWESQKDKRSQR